MREKPCVLILGMDGSGASALAGCLDMLGFNFGGATAQGREGNRPGYVENRDIVLAHENLLHDLDARWDDVGPLPLGWEESEAARKAESVLSGIVQQQFLAGGSPFAVSDPRLCRLLPLWKRLLARLKINCSLILALRHPMEVAEFLQKQKGVDLLKGHLLWLLHTKEALASCSGEQCSLVTFDEFSADPIATLCHRTGRDTLNGIDPREHAREILDLLDLEWSGSRQIECQGIDHEPFLHYAWVYDQVCHLQRKTSGPAGTVETGQRLFIENPPEKIAEFSSMISESTILSAADGRIHPVDVLKTLLEIIERYEQIDPDGYPARQRRFIGDVDAGKSLYFQIYFPVLDSNSTFYPESNSNKFFLNPEEWQNIDIYLPDPRSLREGKLRLKPLNTLGFVSISGLKLVNAATGRECWSFGNASAEFVMAKDAIILPAGQHLEIVVTGDDPELLLPTLPDLPDCPVSLKAWFKVSRSQRDFHRYWKDLHSEKEKLHKNEQTFEEMKKILRSQEETLYKAHKDLREKQESLASLKEQLTLNTREFARLKAESDLLGQRIQDKDQRLQEARENLVRQKNLIRDYFNALAGAEKRQLHLEWKVDGLSQANNHLQARIKNLREVKDQFKLKVRSLSQERAQLQAWIKELHRQYLSLLSSRRWRIGNALVTYAGFAFGRRGRAQGMDRMGMIFTRF
jgi:hypothetical protein